MQDNCDIVDVHRVHTVCSTSACRAVHEVVAVCNRFREGQCHRHFTHFDSKYMSKLLKEDYILCVLGV